jgi:hypothetical protein
MSVSTIMAMILSFNILYAILSGPAGRLSDRLGRQRLIIAGWAVYGLVAVQCHCRGGGSTGEFYGRIIVAGRRIIPWIRTSCPVPLRRDPGIGRLRPVGRRATPCPPLIAPSCSAW